MVTSTQSNGAWPTARSEPRWWSTQSPTGSWKSETFSAGRRRSRSVHDGWRCSGHDRLQRRGHGNPLVELALGLGIVALVLMMSALASGLVERAPVSFPMIFLALGFVLGPLGIGLVRLGPDNQILHIVAVLALSLVLFLDAVNLERAQERHDLFVPLLTLGPAWAPDR